MPGVACLLISSRLVVAGLPVRVMVIVIVVIIVVIVLIVIVVIVIVLIVLVVMRLGVLALAKMMGGQRVMLCGVGQRVKVQHHIGELGDIVQQAVAHLLADAMGLAKRKLAIKVDVHLRQHAVPRPARADVVNA